MVVLRRTNRLQSLLPASSPDHAHSDTALGDWYVNRIVVHRKPLLLLISSKSLLPLVLPARDVRTLPERLAGLVRQRLLRLGVSNPLVQTEISAMSPVLVAKTTDRAVLGILVDFAKSVPYYLPERASTEEDLARVEAQLEDTPCYVTRQYGKAVFPRDKALALLEQR
jgi:hypothetical protein